MSCKTTTVPALAAAMLLSAAPAALAHGDHGAAVCSCGQPLGYSAPAYNHGYTAPAYTNAAYVPNQGYNYGYWNGQRYTPSNPPVHRTAYRPGWTNGYNGHWHGNTFYGYGNHWGMSVDAQLFAAAANGDVYSVKRLIERGANVNARDTEGLSPLSWASQYGRTEVAKYLIEQRAHVNPADRYGFTPLMWAAQEGHTPTVQLLLSRGANPWVASRNGVSAYTLARYSGSWTSAQALESWLDGRRYTNTIRPNSIRAAAPVRVTAAAAPAAPAPVVAAPTALAAAPADVGMLGKVMAFKKLGETGARFADHYMGFMKTIASGGLSLNTLSAASDPDVETGKQLSVFFANVARTQDLKAGREELTKTRGSLKADSKFATYVDEAEKALKDAGF